MAEGSHLALSLPKGRLGSKGDFRRPNQNRPLPMVERSFHVRFPICKRTLREAPANDRYWPIAAIWHSACLRAAWGQKATTGDLVETVCYRAESGHLRSAFTCRCNFPPMISAFGCRADVSQSRWVRLFGNRRQLSSTEQQRVGA